MNPASALATKAPPLNCFRIILTGAQPALEELLADAARKHEAEKK